RDFHVTGVQTCALPICAEEQRLDWIMRAVAAPAKNGLNCAGSSIDSPMRRLGPPVGGEEFGLCQRYALTKALALVGADQVQGTVLDLAEYAGDVFAQHTH